MRTNYLILFFLLISISCQEAEEITPTIEEGLREPYESVMVEFELRGIDPGKFSVKYGDTPGERVYTGTSQSIIWVNPKWTGLNAELFIFHGVGHILGLEHSEGIMSANAADVLIEYGSKREEYLDKYFAAL